MLEVAVNEWEERLLQEGRQEGRQEGIVTTAYRMLNENFPVDVIVRVTGLSEAEIEELKKNHNLDN